MRNQGLTLLEILVVLGIVILFLALAVPGFRSFQQVSYLENTGKEVIATLRLAQSRTLASQGASQYGVYFNDAASTHEYVMFEGASYAARNPVNDEVHELPKTIEISAISFGGSKEVAFSRLTGDPSATGTITFRQAADPLRTKSISVLSSGVVQENSASSPLDEDRVTDSRHVHVSYQGRIITTSTESVRLVFPDTALSFPIADHMSDGQIFWEGDVVSEGEPQHVKVHTHLLNDVSQGTLFSLHRDRSRNTKPLSIELSGEATGNLISYDAAGITTQGTSIYAREPDIQ